MVESNRIFGRLRTWLLLALITLASLAQQVTGKLSIHYLNVGQGDAILIECPEPQHHTMLIDSGDVTAMRYPGSPKLFQDQLKAAMNGRTRIDVVVASHPHSDHTGGLLWVLNNYEVGTFIDDGVSYPSATWRAIEQRASALAAEGRTNFLHVTGLDNGSHAPDFCPTSDVDAILLKPRGFGQDSNPNDNSVVVKVAFKTESFLFTGDAETEEEDLLLHDPATAALLPSTVLKAPHHGSNTSSGPDFLNAVKPSLIVVSAGLRDIGTNRGYKHPRAETIRRFLQFTTANGTQDQRTIDAFDTAKNQWTTLQINKGIYDTALDGAVVLLSDGLNTWKEGDPTPAENIPVTWVSAKRSKVYHFAECADAKRILPENRIESTTPPKGKDLHRGCPR